MYDNVNYSVLLLQSLRKSANMTCVLGHRFNCRAIWLSTIYGHQAKYLKVFKRHGDLFQQQVCVNRHNMTGVTDLPGQIGYILYTLEPN